MKKYKVFSLSLLILLMFVSIVRAEVVTIYVSPNGNDSNDGLSKEKPFATITKARDTVRNLKSNGATKDADNINILLDSGIYRISEPLEFTPEDSGLHDEQIKYSNYSESKPVISGGKVITGWKKGKKGIWSTVIPDAKNGVWKFKQLYVNGESRPRTRLPKEGFYRVKGFPDGGPDVKYNTPSKRFEFTPGDINPKWSNMNDAEVILYHYWIDVHLPIASIDTKTNIVTFSKSSQRRFTDDFQPTGARYIVENVFEALTEPGEWYLNTKTGVLYYKPKAGEDMNTVEITAPFASALIKFTGDPMKRQYVENISFIGISFMHNNWDLSEKDAGDLQAASSVPGAITFEGARDCGIEKCDISLIATYGIQIDKGCRSIVINNNDIHDIGAGGVRVDGSASNGHVLERTGGNYIVNNHIHNIGNVFPSANGVWLADSDANIVSHNEIDHTYYTGISIGWVWGYGRSVSRDNIIEYNHIHDIGQGLLSDMGGIYLLGTAPGTKVRNNLIHDVNSYSYGGWGIYPDEGSTHLLVENNIVYKTKCGGFHQHYGRENYVRNNIFAFSRTEGQVIRSRQEEHQSFFFENNIVMWDESTLLGSNWDNNNYVMDYNLYYNPKVSPDSVKFKDWTFDEWKKRGKDTHSIIADPKFKDPYKGDFTLAEDSPAFGLGFRPIDISRVGPIKNASMAELIGIYMPKP